MEDATNIYLALRAECICCICVHFRIKFINFVNFIYFATSKCVSIAMVMEIYGWINVKIKVIMIFIDNVRFNLLFIFFIKQHKIVHWFFLYFEWLDWYVDLPNFILQHVTQITCKTYDIPIKYCKETYFPLHIFHYLLSRLVYHKLTFTSYCTNSSLTCQWFL